MSDPVREFLDAPKDAGTPLSDAIKRQPKNYRAAQPADRSINLSFPMDVHPDSLGPEDTTSITVGAGRRALGELWTVHEKLAEAARSVENKADLAAHVEPIALKAMKGMREAIAALERQEAHFQSEIVTAMGQGVGALASETRAIIRDLPEAERGAFVRKLMVEGATDALKAISAVPAYMSLLDAEHHALARETCEFLIAPKAVEELKGARAALARCRRAHEHFDENIAAAIRKWRSSDDQKIKNLLKEVGDG